MGWARPAAVAPTYLSRRARNATRGRNRRPGGKWAFQSGAHNADATDVIRRMTVALLALGSFALPFAGTASPASAAGTLRLARTMDRTIGSYHTTSGTSESFSTPGIADISGDGVPEIVVAGMDGTVVAYKSDGSVRWSTHVANAAIEASPVLADVGGDGIRDVVIGAMDGSVVWLNGPNGAIVHRYRDTPSLACQPGVYCKPRGFFGTPSWPTSTAMVLPEIIASSWDHQLYALAPQRNALVPPVPRGHQLVEPGRGRHRQQRQQRDHHRRRSLCRRITSRRRRLHLGAPLERHGLPRLPEIPARTGDLVQPRGC